MNVQSGELVPVDGENPASVATAFGVLVSARASFWLDNNNRKLFKFFNEDLTKRHSSSVFPRLDNPAMSVKLI